MVRPRRCRRIFSNPRITYFKPAGVLLRNIENSILTRDELEADGYKIFFKSIRTRFGCQDFAKLFDIVAAKEEGRQRRLISVKTFVSNSRHTEHKRDIQEFANKHSLLNEKCELWLWHKEGRGWEIITW